MDLLAARRYILKRLELELPIGLSYHSLQHTLDVVNASLRIGKKEGIGETDLMILETAALYHDSGFLIHAENHEQHSCNIARQVLPGFGYAQSVIDKVCDMIMATAIPQSPKSHLAQILCDADLDYLGTDDYYRIGELLFEEFLLQGIIDDEPSWNLMQVRFLESHSYFTKTAIEERSSLKQKHLEYVKAIVAGYEN